MASKFIQPPLPASHVSPPKPPSAFKIKRRHHDNTAFMSTHSKSIGFLDIPCGSWSTSTAKASANDDVIIQDCSNASQIKENLYAALKGINRGIFGVPSEKKTEIEKLVEVLESQNPNPQSTLCIDKAAGTWKLIYSTITILGSKRTKLGLRDFITLGDFLQSIDVAKGKAANVIKFSVKGLNLLNGQLTIDASFKIASETRVDITYINSMITPNQIC